MIKNFTPRLYQETILATAIKKNTLVVLPTGMGKTNIFLMLAAYRLKQYPESKILFIGPTRPLVDQYYDVFSNHFEIEKEKMAIFTGFVAPEKRAELWKKSSIIFSTPQGLENDIISRKINLEEVSLLGVDEAHRAVGDYAYVFVAKQYEKLSKYPRILALTASPGSDVETIAEVCKNLFIEEIEVRTEEDPDVMPYVQEIDVDWVKVILPEKFMQIKKYLEDFVKDRIKKIAETGYVPRGQIGSSKKDLLQLQASLHGEIAQGNKDFEILRTVSLLAEVMKMQHALELLETQGISALWKYFEKMDEESKTTKVKAVQNLVKDLHYRSAKILVERLYEENVEHPKLDELKKIIVNEVAKNKEVKIIVFNQYRDSASKLSEEMNKLPGIISKIFVGQMKKGDTGLTQKEQKRILDEFKEGQFNVLISTSVGEEGLDVPSVDLVIFYEPIPSAIRSIQRRGRTGRQEKGRVIVLIAKNTRDEAYRWSAHHKEKMMYRTLSDLKRKIRLEKKPDSTLSEYVKETPLKIFADVREKGSGVIKELVEMNVQLELKQLSVGDFICSNRVGIEIKTVEDFVNSIIDARLLVQIKELKRNFERPLLILEGEQDIYSVRKLHPNAIRGMLATIAISYGIPIIQTKNYRETSALIYSIAKREQEEFGKDFSLHGDKKPLTLKELQEYIISALPGVGAVLSKPLLEKFGSVKNVINASEEALKEVELIGEKKSREIKKATDSSYEKEK